MQKNEREQDELLHYHPVESLTWRTANALIEAIGKSIKQEHEIEDLKKQLAKKEVKGGDTT